MSDKLIREVQRRIAQSPSPDLQDVLALYALLLRSGAVLGEVWVIRHEFEDDEDYVVTHVCASETGAYVLALDIAKEIVEDRIENWSNPQDIKNLKQSFRAVIRHSKKSLQDGFKYWKEVTEPRLTESITIEKVEFHP